LATAESLCATEKGAKDRGDDVAGRLRRRLKEHLAHAKAVHERDLQLDSDRSIYQTRLERKYPNAHRSWIVAIRFPAANGQSILSQDACQRHHVLEKSLQNAVAMPVRATGITKPASCHSLRHFIRDAPRMAATIFARWQEC